MDPKILAEIRQLQLPIEELRLELDRLERGSFLQLSDTELFAQLSILHAGYRILVEPIPPQTWIYRALNIAHVGGQRPTHRSQVSYPPEHVLPNLKRGRLNEPREAVFYGALGGYLGCLEECSWSTGQLFALSGWLTKEQMWVYRYGYGKQEVMAAAQQSIDISDADISERDALLRDWQSRVLKQEIRERDNELYRLPVALRKFAWAPMSGDSPSGLTQLSGAIYPSVATKGWTSNIALRTSEVDSKLALYEVAFLVLHDRQDYRQPDGQGELQLHPRYYDFARPDSDGNLIWGQRTQIVLPNGMDNSQSPPHLLEPEEPYSHCR